MRMLWLQKQNNVSNTLHNKDVHCLPEARKLMVSSTMYSLTWVSPAGGHPQHLAWSLSFALCVHEKTTFKHHKNIF